MLTMEGAITVLVYLQPPVIGIVFFCVAWRRLTSSQVYSVLGLIRQRRPAVRAFECAVPSRLGQGGAGAQNGVELSCQAFLALFLLYDLDYLFFLSEAVHYYHWSGAQAGLGLLYTGLFVLGAWLDNNVYSPTWAYTA